MASNLDALIPQHSETDMQAYEIRSGEGIDSLRQVDRASPTALANEVVVRMHAVSLNYRDLMVAEGRYLIQSGEPVVPCSDGAGEVIAVGPAVTRFRPGERVAATFFPDWIDGGPSAQTTARSLGGNMDGMLAEDVVLRESALVGIPDYLDYTDAAGIPCAGVTAWNALFVTGDLKPGDTVLLQGTGGVSIWALQLAKAAGMRAIITSSSDEKLQRARALGADDTINYRDTPEWQDEVLRLTHGRGADLVVEVGGKGTLTHSLAAVRMAGTVAVIGGLSGFDGDLGPMSLIAGAKRLAGIYVGSRRMFEDLNRFLEIARIKPMVDRVFGFDEAPAAYRHLAAAGHFGKVVIEVGR